MVRWCEVLVWWASVAAAAVQEEQSQLEPHVGALFFSQTALVHHAQAIGRLVQHRTLQLYEPSDDTVSEEDQVAAVALQTICQSIQQSFASHHSVTCTCAGNIADSFSVSCEYATPLCTTHETTSVSAPVAPTCGKPQIAISMVQGKLFSATTCVTEYSRGSVALSDTCIFVDACPNAKDGFCDCTASYGSDICDECRVCDGGHALTVDCTNVNAEAVSTSCRAVDLDWHLHDGAGTVAGFAPVFEGFCSQLEASLNNTIACDCTNAVGGTYALSCRTTRPTCIHSDTCGHVVSTVHVEQGQMASVTACASYEAPFGETCTNLQLCRDDMGAHSDVVCGCSATYNGQPCQSCTLCDEDQASVSLDCSNVNPLAVTECQVVSSRTSFEFLPDYPGAVTSDVIMGSAAAPAMWTTAVALVPILLVGMMFID